MLGCPARLFPVLLFASMGLAACSSVEDLPIPQVATQEPLPVQSVTHRPILAFSKLAIRMEPGTIVGARRAGAICGGRQLKIGEEVTDRITRKATEAFHEVAEEQGYAVARSEDSLFQDAEELPVDYLVGAGILDTVVNYCINDYGESYLKLEWQVFDQSARKIAYQTETEGVFRTDEVGDSEGPTDLLLEAFRAAARNLMADARYHALLSRPKGTGT